MERPEFFTAVMKIFFHLIPNLAGLVQWLCQTTPGFAILPSNSVLD